jgi:hypothetical protein
MKNNKNLIHSLLVIAAGMAFSACVDDSYDMSKDIDMTMGFGSKELQLNVGNSEKIWLSDILEVDKEEMLETTSAGTFYLVKGDNADFSFKIPTFSATIDAAKLTPNIPVVSFDALRDAMSEITPGYFPTQIEIQENWSSGLVPLEIASSNDFSLTNLPREIKHLKRITPDDDSRTISVALEIVPNSDSQKFVIDSYEDLEVTLPNFFKLKGQDSNLLSIGTKTAINSEQITLAEFTIDALELEGDMGLDLSSSTSVNIKSDYAVKGKFSVKATEDFNLKSGDETTIRIIVKVGKQSSSDKVRIAIGEVTGVFSPTINPNISPINIGSEVPDFLTDPEVCIMAANPTFRMNVDMSQVPANLTLWGNLYGTKKGTNISEVRIPDYDVVALNGKQQSVIYFCQDETPFDPNGVEAAADIYKVENLNDVVKTIPDQIKVDMNNGKINLAEELCSIALGSTYNASLNYNVYVPFKFNTGLKIVYNETIEDMSADLEDLAAEGAEFTATIDNKIPLALQLNATPLDKSCNPIAGVKVSSVEIPASAESQVAVSITFANPNDLQKLDQLLLKVNAETVADDVTLSSDQYLQLKDIRMKLLGQIIADLN